MNQQVSPLIQNMLRDKSITMQQKLTAFMLFTDPKQIPENPKANTHIDLGMQIKHLIDTQKIAFGKMQPNGNIIIMKS